MKVHQRNLKIQNSKHYCNHEDSYRSFEDVSRERNIDRSHIGKQSGAKEILQKQELGLHKNYVCVRDREGEWGETFSPTLAKARISFL